ncbi:uncharacterized protein LOC134752102 isoform X2 [Cydia strobilella]|uniref:uncharacterized protein LOC134752102 isoform X2 n=1 Tax=Cydia strobilella TaxID=1100964 RepID=UPI003004AEC6
MSLEVRVKVESLEDSEVSLADVWKDNNMLCDTSSSQAVEYDNTICVKEEPNELDLKAALSSLYTNHMVNDELVLGPECAQSNDDKHQKLILTKHLPRRRTYCLR